MTIGDIATHARFLTNSDSTSFPDANLLIGLNNWYQKAASMILESQDEQDFDDMRATNYPVQTTPMIASIRDYTMPVSEAMLKIKRVDMAFDGVNYYESKPLDDGELDFGLGNDANTDQNFIRTYPRHDVKYNSLFVYPMPNATDVASGGVIRVEWERNVTPFTSAELTTGTAIPGFDAPFHPILAYGAAFEYATARQLPQLAQITGQLQDFEARLRMAYGRKEWDRRPVLVPDTSNSYR